MDDMLVKLKVMEKVLNVGLFSEERIDDIFIGELFILLEDIFWFSLSYCIDEFKLLFFGGRFK